VVAAVGVLWAAATPYIDMRIDRKIVPIKDALLYQKCLIKASMDSLKIKKADEMYHDDKMSVIR